MCSVYIAILQVFLVLCLLVTFLHGKGLISPSARQLSKQNYLFLCWYNQNVSCTKTWEVQQLKIALYVVTQVLVCRRWVFDDSSIFCLRIPRNRRRLFPACYLGEISARGTLGSSLCACLWGAKRVKIAFINRRRPICYIYSSPICYIGLLFAI